MTHQVYDDERKWKKKMKRSIKNIDGLILQTAQDGSFSITISGRYAVKKELDELEAHYVALGYTFRYKVNENYESPICLIQVAWPPDLTNEFQAIEEKMKEFDEATDYKYAPTEEEIQEELKAEEQLDKEANQTGNIN